MAEEEEEAAVVVETLVEEEEEEEVDMEVQFCVLLFMIIFIEVVVHNVLRVFNHQMFFHQGGGYGGGRGGYGGGDGYNGYGGNGRWGLIKIGSSCYS